MSADAQVTLNVTFVSEEAGYANAMGWYNSRTGEAGILFLDLNDDGKHAGVHAGDARTLTVLQSDLDAGSIGFFLIPDGSSEYSDSILSSPMKFVVGSNGDGKIVIDRAYGSDVVLKAGDGDVLFSDRQYNKSDYDYVSGTVGTDGQTKAQKFGEQSDGADGILGTMAWDDQVVQPGNKGSDRDFNDVVFKVSLANAAPNDITLSNQSLVEESDGAIVGLVAGVDPDGDPLSFTVSDSRFEIVGGVLKLKAGESIDFEAELFPTIELTITAQDPGLASFSETFTINIVDLPAGLAIDGYLAGATVFADANGDGVLDKGEASTTTDAFGNFEFDANGASLVMVGGIDIATGLAFEGKLTASAGSSVITPLTTLLAELEAANVPDPQGVLAAALGLDPVPDFGNLDPIAFATASGGSIDAFAASSQILNTVNMVAAVIVGFEPELTRDQTIVAAFATLAAQMASGDLFGFDETGELQTLIEDTASSLLLSVGPDLVEDAATVIAASNAYVRAAAASGDDISEKLKEITQASIVAQDDTAAALEAAAGGPGPALPLDEFVGANLAGHIAAAEGEVGNIAGSPGASGTDDPDNVLLGDDSDTYDGKGGADFIAGGGGLDILHGGAGTDELHGNDGNDLLYGGADNDTLIGGAGDDLLDGGAGDDTYYHSGNAATDGHDTIASGISGTDKIVFTAPVLYDAFPERNGNDLIVGVVLDEPGFPFDGTITIKDFYTSTAPGIFVQFDGPYNEVYGTDPNLSTLFVTRDLENGVDDNETYTEVLFGSSEDDTINGNGGFYDAIFGGIGKDTIHGGEGVDNIRGGKDDDKLYGDEGDDVLRGEGGDDYLDGGADNDTARYNFGSLVAAVWADLEAGIATDLNPADDLLGTDTLVNIENLRGSNLGDELYGDGQDNRLRGEGGNDILQGRGGNDTLQGGTGADEYRHSGTLADGDDTIFTGDNGIDYIVFTTPDLYDLDFFRDGSDLVVGAYLPDGPMTGSLRIVDHYAGAAIAYVQIDTELYNLFYGTDADAAKFLFATDIGSGLDDNDTIEVLLGTQDDDEIHGNGGFYDALYGSGGDDKLYGEGGFDHLRAGFGDDELYGGEGNDRLRGDQDNDYLDGGDGVDLARYDRGTGAVEVDLVAGFAKDRDLNGNSGQDTLINVEEVRASNFDDLVMGDGGENLLEGRGGNDFLDGRTGSDTLLGDGGDDVLSAEDGEQDYVEGGDGNDTLISDGALDILVGGAGSDIYRITGFAPSVADLARIVDFDFAPGQDRIDLSMWIAGFIPGVSDPADFVELVQVGPDTILRLDGSGSGGPFLDMVVIENFSEDLATLIANHSLLLAPQFGTDDPDVAILTEGADIFNALGGDDEITALGGNDLLTGGQGNDIINGGDGADEYRHSGTTEDGDDTITTGEDGLDYVVFTTPDLYDLLYFRDGDDLVMGGYLEGGDTTTGSVRIAGHYAGAAIAYAQIDTELYNLFYGTDADAAKFYFTTNIADGEVHDDGVEVLLGTGDNETINGDGGFYDALYGLGGDDILNGDEGTDWLRGGSENDQLYGGIDDDHLRGDQGDDLIDGGFGIDRVRYNNASAGVEVDLIAGVADQRDEFGNSGHDTLKDVENVQGSNFGDLLSGDDGANQLQGRGGDDTLTGRAGDDVLVGDNGLDELFGGGDNDNAFGGNDGDTVDGGAGDDFLFGDGGDDKITGGDGFDTLDGGDDNDVLNGGADIDTLTGGAGADTFAFSHASADGGQRNDDYITDYNYFEGDIIDLSDLLEDDEIDPGLLGAIFIILPTDEGTGLTIDADGPGGANPEFVVNIGNIPFDTPIAFKVDDTYYNYDGNIIT